METITTLKGMADELSRLTQSDGMRQYFDDMCPWVCVYDSSKIFNFLSCCEEVADYIHDGKYKEAEEIIDAFMF